MQDKSGRHVTRHDINEIESEYFELRGRLRALRGRVDIYLAGDIGKDAHGYMSADEKNAKFMRGMLNTSISHLDRYDDMKEFNRQFEELNFKLVELSERGDFK